MKNKEDHQFLTNFIQSCINDGITSSDEMTLHAKKIIEELNVEISKINDKIKLKNNLLIAVSRLGKKISNSSSDKNILKYYQINDHKTCMEICKLVSQKPLDINCIPDYLDKNKVIPCIKEMCENNIIAQSGDLFLRGDMFSTYYSVIGRR